MKKVNVDSREHRSMIAQVAAWKRLVAEARAAEAAHQQAAARDWAVLVAEARVSILKETAALLALAA